MKKLAELYKENLLNNVMPFWLKHSPDALYGGFLTCLDRDGSVYDTDKFVWLQCRQVWTLSMLYQNVEPKQEWLQQAIKGAKFLQKFGRDAEKNWYFSLDRAGKPLTQPFNIFSDCFACMAFAQLSKATNNAEYAEIAKETFYNILARQNNPKGKYSKAYPGTRELQGFSLPMILCNLVLEIEHLLSPEEVNSILDHGVHTVMEVFYQPERKLILENVDLNGNFNDSFEGRLVNPGHGLEAMWFVMDIAKRSDNQELIAKCVDISLSIIEFGWDQEHGGIFYFLDADGHPPQQLEWDQKLWWVHIEAMITFLKGYQLTGNEKCLEWFNKLHDYTWNHFVDKEYGEWFGYLNRKGEVLLPLKGGKWKGCFHVPRGLYQLYTTIEKIESTNELKLQRI